MDRKDRDNIDDLFRDRLYDFETDIDPKSWEAIAGRLPEAGRSVPLRRTFRYWAAAAAVFLLAVSTGIYFLTSRPRSVEQVPVAVVAPESASGDVPVAAGEPEGEVAGEAPVVAGARPVVLPVRMLALADPVSLPEEEEAVLSAASLPDEPEQPRGEVAREVYRPAEPRMEVGEARSRKWGFGMGAGGFSVGSNNLIQGSVLKNSKVDEDQLDMFNAASNSLYSTNTPKTNVRHKTPVSFSLGVSRFLTDRWSLQTGLSYSYLVSEWEMNGIYRGATKQKLHFLGIPLSVAYKIVEWNRFQVYAAAGAMAEVNLTGITETTLYSGSEKLGSVKDRIRMDEWYWSVNARAGVSYPLLRFLSAFAEVGASYYFDNGSDIETIHSDKPFNVSFNVGLRLGL